MPRNSYQRVVLYLDCCTVQSPRTPFSLFNPPSSSSPCRPVRKPAVLPGGPCSIRTLNRERIDAAPLTRKLEPTPSADDHRYRNAANSQASLADRVSRKRQWPSVRRDRASSRDRSGLSVLPCTRSGPSTGARPGGRITPKAPAPPLQPLCSGIGCRRPRCPRIRIERHRRTAACPEAAVVSCGRRRASTWRRAIEMGNDRQPREARVCPSRLAVTCAGDETITRDPRPAAHAGWPLAQAPG
jgi:hypothetical protein